MRTQKKNKIREKLTMAMMPRVITRINKGGGLRNTFVMDLNNSSITWLYQ